MPTPVFSVNGSGKNVFSDEKNRIGMILIGGLNPVAAAVEAGIEVENTAGSGIIDFERLISFWQL